MLVYILCGVDKKVRGDYSQQMENNLKRILLLEDDAMIASGVVYALENEGYEVFHKKTVLEAKNFLRTEKVDLAVLDMQLPDGTGFDVPLDGTRVIFLTVDDDEASIVKAFEGGAEDYVTKPFRIRELLARVRRTLSAGGAGNLLSAGGVSIDTAAGKVYARGELCELTALEYRLLLTLATHRGQVLTRTQILEHIWDCAGSFVEDNTLTVYIKRLREKLDGALEIATVRGVGYRVD